AHGRPLLAPVLAPQARRLGARSVRVVVPAGVEAFLELGRRHADRQRPVVVQLEVAAGLARLREADLQPVRGGARAGPRRAAAEAIWWKWSDGGYTEPIAASTTRSPAAMLLSSCILCK